MNRAPVFIIRRQLALFDQADKIYGQVVCGGLKKTGIYFEEGAAA